MSYHILIEGFRGARRIRRGALPRQGEWLQLKLEGSWCWLPVLEVTHMLRGELKTPEGEGESEVAHAEAEDLVVTSRSLAVEASCVSPEDAYQLVLPPTRWPLGGSVEGSSPLEENPGPRKHL